MQTQLGCTDMVRWQGRRMAAENRAKSRVVRLMLLFAALAVASLTVGFYSGLPVLFLLGAVAFVARAGVDRLVHRQERGLVRRRP